MVPMLHRCLSLWSLLLLLTTVVHAADYNTVYQQGVEFLEARRQVPNVVSLPSGLLYLPVESGWGTTSPTETMPCTFHYIAALSNGTVFDASQLYGGAVTAEPKDMPLGVQQALTSMVVGDLWEVYVPSHLGYGDVGVPGLIPPGSALIFRVRLVSFETCHLCPAGSTLQHSNISLPQGFSCGELHQYAPDFGPNTETCAAIQSHHPACCSEIAACPMCHGAIPTTMDRAIELPGLPTKTCRELWYESHFSDTCTDSIDLGPTKGKFDVEYYCGCPAAIEPHVNSCGSLCQKNLINADSQNYLGLWDGVTCQEVNDLYPYFMDETCVMLDDFMLPCCQNAASCSMCQKLPLVNPDRAIPYDTVNCEELRMNLYSVTETECGLFDNLDANEVYITAWCGCQEAANKLPKNSCTASCPDLHYLKYPDAMVPAAGVTCQALMEFIPYVTDATGHCAQIQQDLNDYCCDWTESVAPSTSPSMQPSLSSVPSTTPSSTPSTSPPSTSPSGAPTDSPAPSRSPSSVPTLSFEPTHSAAPSATPTSRPTRAPRQKN